MKVVYSDENFRKAIAKAKRGDFIEFRDIARGTTFRYLYPTSVSSLMIKSDADLWHKYTLEKYRLIKKYTEQTAKK